LSLYAAERPNSTQPTKVQVNHPSQLVDMWKNRQSTADRHVSFGRTVPICQENKKPTDKK
jgi:hypothetical protein